MYARSVTVKVSRTLWSVISTPIRLCQAANDLLQVLYGQRIDAGERLVQQYKGRFSVSDRAISSLRRSPPDSMYALLARTSPGPFEKVIPPNGRVVVPG